MREHPDDAIRNRPHAMYRSTILKLYLGVRGFTTCELHGQYLPREDERQQFVVEQALAEVLPGRRRRVESGGFAFHDVVGPHVVRAGQAGGPGGSVAEARPPEQRL